MVLPSMIHSFVKEELPHNSRDHIEEWPPLPGCASTQRRGAILVPEKVPDFQFRNLKSGRASDRLLIKTGKFQT
jgi:hypothetical protein